MTNFAAGRAAEAAAAKFLQTKGYKIITQNWRTRWCEIDIIAQKGGAVYFCEVKYRVSDREGGGLDYITSRKLSQMRFAAEFWVAEQNWNEECQLLAIEVSGPQFEITSFIEDL